MLTRRCARPLAVVVMHFFLQTVQISGESSLSVCVSFRQRSIGSEVHT